MTVTFDSQFQLRASGLYRYSSIIFIFGFALTSFAFYPGLTSPDSDFQYLQVLTSNFSDGHPLISTLIWKFTDLLFPGPAGYFFLLLSLYWIGFLILSKYFYSSGPSVYCLSLLLPFAPFLINFSGTLWKDVLLFGCYLVATGVALYYYRKTTPINLFLSFLMLALILVAALARYNSALAAVPLIVLLWTARGHVIHSPSELVKAYLLSGMIAASAVVVGLTVLDHVMRPAKTHYIGSLFLFDLMGVSYQLEKNIVPGPWTSEQDKQILTTCYDPQWWDTIWLSCMDILKETQARQWENLPQAWRNAILAHPKEYLTHRFKHFMSFFTVNMRDHVFNRDVTRLALDHGFRSNFVFRFFDDSLEYLRTSAGTKFLFTRGFWIVYSTVLCLGYLMAFMTGSRQVLPELLISLSGASYALPLVFVGISVDLRYVYWTICCCSIVTLMLLGSLKGRALPTRMSHQQ